MLLIGQYDSPFVRRVAVTLKTYGLAYDHEPWSTFGEADKIARYNPLRRVPTLVLDNGTVLVDSTGILAALDALVGPDAAVLTRTGADGLEILRISGFAAGAADKGVSLLYERVLRSTAFPLWVDRCQAQISETLGLLEAIRAARETPFLFDDRPSHADIILATMFRFLSEALPGEFDFTAWPALGSHSQRCERLPAFAAAYQPYRLVQPDLA
jgi:glutathione S-transferase